MNAVEVVVVAGVCLFWAVLIRWLVRKLRAHKPVEKSE
jgi:hypothetical protein